MPNTRIHQGIVDKNDDHDLSLINHLFLKKKKTGMIIILIYIFVASTNYSVVNIVRGRNRWASSKDKKKKSVAYGRKK